MAELRLNSDQFNRRAKILCNKLEKPLLVILGKASDVQEFNLNSALFHFLLGYEFPETILVIQEEPIAIVSAKKALILQQIKDLNIVIKNKDDSNMNDILASLTAEYGLVDVKNIKGDFCSAVLGRISHVDVTQNVKNILAIKDSFELDYIRKSGIVANYLLQKGIELIRDMSFTKDRLEEYMNDTIRGIDNSVIEYSFDPEDSSNHLRVGVRYRGYCSEIARSFLMDASDSYAVQDYFLSIARPGVGSKDIIDKVRTFCNDKNYNLKVDAYNIGLMEREENFETDFVLQRGMVFCLNVSGELCNTFVLEDTLVFITKKDSALDYSEARMRVRNKGNDTAVVAKIKEHQKELLEKLIEEQVEYYKSHADNSEAVENEVKVVSCYDKDSAVPRSNTLFLDWDNNYVLIPILSYSVPFHISSIKNVSAAADGSRLRINFKESKEIQAISEAAPETRNNVEDAHEQHKDGGSNFNSLLKSITVRVSNCEEMMMRINEMKKDFNKPKLNLKEQGALKEKYKKYALTDLYMRTDNRTNVKKVMANLELHENGFKYSGISVLFSSIKNIFYELGDAESRAIIHFNLKQPISVQGKPTKNIQFFRKFGFTYYDTNKREDERLEYIQQEEDAKEINQINSEFSFFVERIEQETPLRVQFPEKGFLGVHSKEAVHFSVTSECLVSVVEQPFFVLSFDEVEIVNFERVTVVTKTFDCVFVFKDKRVPTVAINAVEISRIGFLKELMDSHNIVFMETKVNINWQNLLGTIMQDPVGFYESGAWAELLRDDEDDESEVLSTSGSTSSEVSSVGSTTATDESSETEAESEESYESLATSDEEADEEESSSGDKRKKRRK
ncbi:hypothetical protein PAEPH01_2241 [Pancytospora epiphaga]|nr:hypothetical protein PAEPH01_2241 [Pancytospora epiphaga]